MIGIVVASVDDDTNACDPSRHSFVVIAAGIL